MNSSHVHRIIEVISQQYSFDVIKMVDSVGLLKIDNVMKYIDYCEHDGKCYSLTVLGDTVFVAVEEDKANHTENVVIVSLFIKRILYVSTFQQGKVFSRINPSLAQFKVLDLETSGDRWEGYCLNGKPCGWGRFFNQSNALIYEGYAYDKNPMGYGIQYHPVVGDAIPCYEGSFCFGFRHGKGKLFSRRGELLGESGWCCGHQCLDNVVKVPDNTVDTFFHNTLMSVFIIGDDCYPSVSSLIISGYPSLITLRVGNNCFCEKSSHEKKFCIVGCDKLERIEIGDGSFSFFDCCIIKNLKQLRILMIGELMKLCGSFYHCKELVLQSIDK